MRSMRTMTASSACAAIAAVHLLRAVGRILAAAIAKKSHRVKVNSVSSRLVDFEEERRAVRKLMERRAFAAHMEVTVTPDQQVA